MSYIIKNCPHLVNVVYADGREVCNECGESSEDKKCVEVKNCLFKQIADNLLRVVNADLCNNCDGCGYDEGCLDDNCGTYEAYRCLELLDIEHEMEE